MLKSHYFFALSLPQDTKRMIKEWVQPLQEEASFKRWVHTQDYHLTLAFLGSADDLNPVIDKVEKLTCSSFSLTLGDFGTFGNPDSPRIFWLGVEPSRSLLRVRDLVYDACEDAGYSLDKRPFSPHITVGRKWNGVSPFTTEWMKRFQPTEIHTFKAEEIVLYQTHVDRIPKYEAIHTIPLQAN